MEADRDFDHIYPNYMWYNHPANSWFRPRTLQN